MEKTLIVNENGTPIRFSGANAQACVPHATDEFTPGQPYVGTGGNLKCKMKGGTDWVTFTNVQDGSFLPIEIKAVHTDTTASDILIIY